MSGLRVLLNNRELAAVSNQNRNIISAYVSGDVIGPELATLHLIGGYYGDPEVTTHRIWIDNHVIKEGDEIEIQFLEAVSTSGSGMSIEEHAKAHATDEAPEDEAIEDQDIHTWLARQPKVRERFTFELKMTNSALIKTETEPSDFSFHFSVMWKWTKPNEASVSLTATSLENIKLQKSGTTFCKHKLQLGSGIKFIIKGVNPLISATDNPT